MDAARTDLVVVAEGFDDAEACSTVLDRASALVRDAPVVLRHHLRIPADQIESVCALAAQDGYERAQRVADIGNPDGRANTDPTAEDGIAARNSGSSNVDPREVDPREVDPREVDPRESDAITTKNADTDTTRTAGLEPLILRRVQILDALHCSQERSRMAGLAQRHDGTVDGWDALQPRTDPKTVAH
ncbi:hypothetical protein GCM10023318_38200 [Nocardia callitridis]|uniref:HNH endonuclease n=1 Tax=Nocardia callitridis TaxID=648753 RepID=A0ABP9KJB9_9NOCA